MRCIVGFGVVPRLGVLRRDFSRRGQFVDQMSHFRRRLLQFILEALGFAPSPAEFVVQTRDLAMEQIDLGRSRCDSTFNRSVSAAKR